VRFAFLSWNVSLRPRKRMDLVTIMKERARLSLLLPFVDAECTTSDVTDVIFSHPRKPAPGTGRRGRKEGENNLKAELNFSSSESFVRALGGGQWLNGDVSRKVDSRERPALYRPSIHPTRSSSTPARTRTRECAVLYRREKIYTWQRERERGLCARRSRPASGVSTSEYCYEPISSRRPDYKRSPRLDK